MCENEQDLPGWVRLVEAIADAKPQDAEAPTVLNAPPMTREKALEVWQRMLARTERSALFDGLFHELHEDNQEHRAFNEHRHLRSFAEMPWEAMVDDQGQVLEGIRGKSGASEVGFDSLEIGADLIELQPGAAFPLHVHPGDHILYAIAGVGTVTIDDVVHRFEAGSTFFIAAEYPHAVGTLTDSEEPFVLLAVGHPQKHVADPDRMTVVRNGEAMLFPLTPKGIAEQFQIPQVHLGTITVDAAAQEAVPRVIDDHRQNDSHA